MYKFFVAAALIGSLGLSGLAVSAAPSATTPDTSPPVATLNGRTVTLRELDSAGGRSLYDVAQQLYEARVRALYQLLSEDLLDREAKAQKQSVDELLATYVDSKAREVSEADLEAFLKAHPGGGSIDARSRKEAGVYLRMKNRAEAKRLYITSLFEKYAVKVALDAPPAPPAEIVLGALEPAIGNPHAPVTIIAFSDYRCPYCRDLAHTFTQLLERFPKDVRVVYRNFPTHADSNDLAEAALCAADQGRFREYHDLLFSTPNTTTTSSLAAQAGLDATAFDGCVQENRHAARIAEDLKEGQRLRINGTPTLFVNGLRMRGAQTLERLAAQVQDALKREAALPVKSTARG